MWKLALLAAGPSMGRSPKCRLLPGRVYTLSLQSRKPFPEGDERVDKIMMAAITLEERIQTVLDDYRPILYKDGGDVELVALDEQGVAHIKMFGACIDCPISLLTMKLGIQRLLKEHFSEIRGVNAITDIDIAALYQRPVREAQ